MRIAIVASDYAPSVGGVQTAVRNIAFHAAQQGHAVTILSSQTSPAVPATEKVEQIVVHRFPWGRRPLITLPGRAFVTLRGMRRILLDFRPDLVYVHFLSINALYVLLLHYWMRFKLVVSARGNDIQGIPARSRIQRWMLPRLFGRADAILFCSAFVQHDAQAFLASARTGTLVGIVGDGYSPEEFEGCSPYSYSSPYVLGAGRLVEKKGFDMLIRGFARVAPDFPQVHLLIAGDGEERPILEGWIDRLRMRERVRLLGFADRQTTLGLFLGCEFFVLSSRVEPFGIVVLEAMGAHKAVLATRSGGVAELVQHGVNGYLVDPVVDGLANGMYQMLAHPEITREMAERAPETIQDRTWAAVAGQFLQVFEQVLQG